MDPELINDLFLSYEQRVSSDVTKAILPSDFYVREVPREAWPEAAGKSYTAASYQRAGLPGTFLPFSAVGAVACIIPTVEASNFAADTRSVTLYQAATNTPDFCLSDIEHIHDAARQLSISGENMSRATRFNWGQEFQNRFIAECDNKLIYTDDAATSTATAWGATAPTHSLDWQILAFVRQELRFIMEPKDAAGVDEEGEIVLSLVGESEIFDALKNLDTNTRGDIRAHMSGGAGGKIATTLLNSPGMPTGTVFRGFKFERIQFAPRYDLVAGVWVQRFPWKAEAALTGQKLEIDPLYKNAAFTDVVVFSKSTFTAMIPPAPKSRNGYEWKIAIDWTGMHKWKLHPLNKVTNPDENIGFWRSVYSYGPDARRPDLGYVIRVKRCGFNFGEIDCAPLVA